MIAGDEKGKKGEVQRVIKESLKAVVTDINLVKDIPKPTLITILVASKTYLLHPHFKTQIGGS